MSIGCPAGNGLVVARVEVGWLPRWLLAFIEESPAGEAADGEKQPTLVKVSVSCRSWRLESLSPGPWPSLRP